jgi:hypothetical protein
LPRYLETRTFEARYETTPTDVVVRPQGYVRPVPAEVPEAIARDFQEACAVLSHSAKASAALSRRCLQHVLHDVAGVKPGKLYDEIEQVLESNRLSTEVATNLDYVRVVGNFSAHPEKSEHSGEVIDVEPDEAEWTLEVLESLFDALYVQPVRAKARRDALEEKTQKRLQQPPSEPDSADCAPGPTG